MYHIFHIRLSKNNVFKFFYSGGGIQLLNQRNFSYFRSKQIYSRLVTIRFTILNSAIFK